LVAFIARELGAGRTAQWIAATAWALTPYILGSASIFHTTWLDALAWTSFLYVAVRLLVRREPRLWLLLGRPCAASPESDLAGAARLAQRPLLLEPKRPDSLGHLTTGVHRRAAASSARPLFYPLGADWTRLIASDQLRVPGPNRPEPGVL
jgi:hypothetical protein